MTDSGVDPRGMLGAIALGTALAPINSTMIAVALPDIQSSFGVSITSTTWLVTIYLAAMAVGLPIGGRLGDMYGRRKVYLAGLVWFAIASAGCALAPDFEALVFFRTQQALAGALSFPNGAAMIRESYPQDRRGSAFGVIGLATGVAAAAGPPIGGLLVHSFGWQAIFAVNVPIIALALALGAFFLPRPRSNTSASMGFDLMGSLLLALTLGGIIAIPAAVKFDAIAVAIGALGIALVAGFVFMKWELHQRAPVIDLRLFSNRSFAAACSSIGLSNLVMYTTLLSMPLYLERVRGHDERVAGLTLAALSVFAGLWGPVGGRVTDRRGRRLPAMVGAVILFVGTLAMFGAVRSIALWPLVLSLGLMGLGLGISSAPIQITALESAPVARAGSAAGVFSTSRYLGSVAGTTALALVFATELQPGNIARFKGLFAGLAIVAFLGIIVNSRIEERWQAVTAE